MKLLISLLFVTVIFSSCQKVPSQELPSSLFKPYSKEAVAASIAQHKPVVIDFWADWCPNCHDLEREVFSRPEIQAQLAQLTTLRVDATDQYNDKVQELTQQYNIEGLPTVVFLDSHGKEIKDARVIGFVTADDFKQALAMVKVLK
jgi:thiol:disulfide interchange protein DsbD